MERHLILYGEELNLLEVKKLSGIRHFIKINPHELKQIEVQNCYFANLSASLIIRSLDPAIIFGGLLGFETYKMIDSRNFLSSYIDYYLEQTWGIDTEDGFCVEVGVENFQDVESFKDQLIEIFKYNYCNKLIGTIMDAKHVFYRQDIDLDFWGEDFISHFSIISDIDFENDTLTLLDATPGKDTESEFPIIKSLNISTLLVYLRKHNDFVSFIDIDRFIEHITEQNKGHEGAIEKVVNSLYEQADNRINKYKGEIINPVEWLITEWKQFKDKDSAVWSNWLEPRLNIFQTIACHRFYVSIFVKKYLQEYFKIPVKQLLDLLDEEEQDMSSLKYLCYKLSVSTREKSLIIIKNDIEKLLDKINILELQISEMILKNIERV